MRTGIKLGLAVGLTAVVIVGYQPAKMAYSIANPEKVDLPLAPHLIAYGSNEGARLLATATATADLEVLRKHFVPQQYASYCGVASSVIALNALGHKVDQDSFFTDATKDVHSKMGTFFGGMTLEQLGGLLKAHGVKADVHKAERTNVDEFRRLARENLHRPGDFVLINYLRKSIDQQAGGHISPVAAYDAGSDRFLVLDVADFKYPPVWVETKRLFDSMNTKDSSSGCSRGFVLVSE